MSNEYNSDIDGVKIKKGLPNFDSKPKAGNDNEAKAKASVAESKVDAAEDVKKRLDSFVDSINSRPKLKILSGGAEKVVPIGDAIPMVNSKTHAAAISAENKTSSYSSFDAKAGFDKDGLNASVGVSMGKSTEVTTSVGAEINKEEVLAKVKSKGKDGKVPLDELSKVLLRQMGVKDEDLDKLEGMDAEARAKAVATISARLSVALREEKGAEMRAGVSMGGGGGRAAGPGGEAAARGGSTIANELIATGGAMIGGLASLASGSARLAGAAAGALGKGLGGLAVPEGKADAKQFDGIAVLPTISEYRVRQTEKAADNYEKAVDRFWKVEPMAALRSEIEDRARKSGISVQDAMAKMKPGGEWADQHAKFVQEVAGSQEATSAKVAMDKALRSYTTQYEHGSEELLSADVDGNPNHRKAKDRIDATRAKMEELSGETPVFGGETESHAERLKAAFEAIMERLRELLAVVREKIFGQDTTHANP